MTAASFRLKYAIASFLVVLLAAAAVALLFMVRHAADARALSALAGSVLGERAEGARVRGVAHHEQQRYRRRREQHDEEAGDGVFQPEAGRSHVVSPRAVSPRAWYPRLSGDINRRSPPHAMGRTRQLPDQTLFICPSINPRMVAMGSALAAKMGGRRRSSCQLSLRRTCRRYSRLRSMASM